MNNKTCGHTLLLTLLLSPIGAMAQTPNDSTVYKSVNLDSVVVTGKRPLVSHDGTKDIVNVKGSYLSGMGNLGNMLKMVPGLVMIGHNQFQVIGKGAPKYYIDGREVTQQDIFNTIKANNVARIEIEYEPSAKYPSGTNAVVNIVTLKPMKDYMSLNLYNMLTMRRKVSEEPSFDFTYSRGKWATTVDYSYSQLRNLNKETYFTEIYRPDYTFRSDEANHSYVRNISHELTWTNDFYINENNRIGLVYTFSHTKDNTTADELTTYKDRDKTEEKDIVRKEKTQRNLHNISLSYSGDLSENSSLNLSADYSILSNHIDNTSDEESRTTHSKSSVYSRSEGTYNIVTLNGSYSFKLPGGIGTEVGARYYNTHYPLDFSTNNMFANVSAASNHQTLSDNVTAGYLSLQRGWKKFYVNVGARYEYSDTRIKINTGTDSYKAARHTSDILPSVTLQWQVAKKVALRGVYMRTLDRQGYQGLNPYPSYKDSLAYATGNVDLRPSYLDRYFLYGFIGNGLVMGVGYVNKYDPIETATFCQSDDRNVTTDMPVNTHRLEHYVGMINYRHAFGKLFFNSNVVVTIPHDVYYFLGKRHTVTTPYWEGNFNLSYPVGKSTSVYTSFSYQSFNKENFCKQRRADNWSAGVQSNLLKKRLTISFGVTDILHHANYNNCSYSYLNTRNGTYGTNDMRGVSLTLTYRLFNRDLSTQSSSGSDDVLMRTE